MFVQGLNDIGQYLYFLIFGEFGVKIVGLEGLLQQRQHHQVRYQQEVISLPVLRQHIQIFIEFEIIDNSFHPFEMTEIILGCEV